MTPEFTNYYNEDADILTQIEFAALIEAFHLWLDSGICACHFRTFRDNDPED